MPETTMLGTMEARTEQRVMGTDAYKPSKADREARRLVWQRYQNMMSNEFRKDAEAEWDVADKMFRQWTPPREFGDWRADLVLPDAFAGVQAQMQETIERTSRPLLKRVEDSDEALEEFGNSILNYNMDRTDFDFQYFHAKYAAAIRGTSFMMEQYHLDKRTVEDPTGVDEDGNLTYTKKEIIDMDDTVTKHIPNEYIFVDDRVLHINDAIDMVYRQVMDLDEFNRVFGDRKDFKDVKKVRRGGDTENKGFFKMPEDMDKNDVEVLHYYNRAIDKYYVLANNVLIRTGPIPYKHKELPIAVIYHYYIPGRFWGMGIPKVIESLSEERRTLRNLNLDRQKMQLNKMVFVNDAIDLDEEELITRPFGIVNVPTNGLPLSQAVMPFEYGDVPASYFRTEEIILEDIRRAHGIDDRIQGVNVGGTATEAAILKESSQRRINMIALLVEMDTMKRIGKLKWSNIQFFYPAPKVERIMEKKKERTKKVYKKINVKGKSFTIVKDDNGKTSLKMNSIDGTSSFKLDKTMATFMGGDVDITVNAEAHSVLSKPLQQAKITEMFNLLAANPLTAPEVDGRKAAQRYLEINEEDPRHWLRGGDMNDNDMKILAEQENFVMSQGTPLSPTKDATEEHTMIHLNFTESAEFQKLPDAIQGLFEAHIAGEHERNPNTGSVADLMAGATGPEGPEGAPAPIAPEMQVADITPSAVTSGGSAPNTGTEQDISLQ